MSKKPYLAENIINVTLAYLASILLAIVLVVPGAVQALVTLLDVLPTFLNALAAFLIGVGLAPKIWPKNKDSDVK